MMGVLSELQGRIQTLEQERMAEVTPVCEYGEEGASSEEDAAPPQQYSEQQLEPEEEVRDSEEVVSEDGSDQTIGDEDSVINVTSDEAEELASSDFCGDHEEQACASIADCVERETEVDIEDCSPREEESREEECEPTKEKFSKVHSTPLVPSSPLLALRFPNEMPEFPQYLPLLGRHEYAYLENDGQLRELLAWSGKEDAEEGGKELTSNPQLTTNKPLGGSSRSSPLGVKLRWNVKMKRSPRVLQGSGSSPLHGSRKLHGSKDRGITHIVWDPGGQRPSKPWWEFLDQFKHKPP